MMNLKNSLNWVKKRWGSIVVYALLALLIFSPDTKSWLLRQVVSTGLLQANIRDDAAGKDLPDAGNFTFTNAAGETATIADLREKVVFINFWASWCPPCRAEMPDLENLYQKLKDDNRFVFLFINEDEDQDKAINYLEKNHFTIPFYTRSGGISNKLFSGSLPTTVVINKEGKIVLKHEGMARYNSDDFIRQLKSLL